MDKNKIRARAALDQRFEELASLVDTPRPSKGWLRALRDALGMTRVQLGQRMGITPQSVSDIEASEATNTIRLETLRKAAEALDCSLVYALVPNTPLQRRVDVRARAIALKQIGAVSHSMAMEDQAVGNDDLEARIEQFVRDTLKDRDLWNEE